MRGANPGVSLVDLGLTHDEARAYHNLLGRGLLGATELSEVAGISRGRIYEVVAGLLRKGVATEVAGPTRQFSAVEPGVAVSNLVEGRRQELRRIESVAEATAAGLAELARDLGSASPVELIRHRATVRQRFTSLEEAATEEILLVTKRPVYIAHAENVPELMAMRRGVRVRSLYESVMLEDPEEREAIGVYLQAGEEARHLPALPAKLAVFDRAVTLFLVDDSDPENVGTVVIRHGGVAELAAAAFEHLWALAESVPAEGAALRAGT